MIDGGNAIREHAALLAEIAGDEFSILHRVDAHVMQPIEGSAR